MTRPKTLLMIDDETTLLEILAEDFTLTGVRCVTASDPELGLRLIETERPDAILCDIRMPRMDGLQLLEKLRERSDPTPLVFLTGYGDKEKITQALRLGAMDFLEKPYERATLHKSVHRALELGVQLRTLEEELDQLVRASGLKPENQAMYKAIKRKLLLNQKHHRVYFNRKAS